MDFKEVGKFFTEKITKGELHLKNLSPTGFEFLQTYFLSANETASKIEKVKPKYNTGGSNYYGMNRGGYSGYGSDYKMSYGTGYGWG